ncbi:MAG: hypothetical protein EOO91_05795 [Pedobacter sp.]|nr:MAG: hypothetical protein EOO91_05795 [Pedobacter sp.]
MLKQLQAYNTVGLFIFYCFFLAAITYLMQSLLLTDNVLYNSYAEQLSYDSIEEMIDGQTKWAWIAYSILPLIYALKFFLVACCLLAGSMFFDLKLKFNEAFKIALLADVVFIIPMLIKVFWFLIVQEEYVLQDIQLFSPLSIISIFDANTLGLLWFYPLQTLNVFELLYIFSLAFWVYQFGAKSFEKGLNLVLSSYVPALFIWVVLVMFVTLN